MLSFRQSPFKVEALYGNGRVAYDVRVVARTKLSRKQLLESYAQRFTADSIAALRVKTPAPFPPEILRFSNPVPQPIFAVTKATQGHKRGFVPTVFAFSTPVQSLVENAMIQLGHSTRGYYLTTTPPTQGIRVRVGILDKDGFRLRVSPMR